jgi:hypothetical protein
MDYIFVSSILNTPLRKVIVSYDIACQWGLNWATRVHAPTMPKHLRPSPSLEITYLVPKFHLEAHVVKCHAPYSFNYTIGVGRTDGEGIERNWSWLNGVASSLSMMGPGARWDTLDDFCNFANWRRSIELGTQM